MRLLHSAVAVAALLACAAGAIESARNEALRAELLDMVQVDQAARRARDSEAIRWADQRHTARLKEIVEAGGWPTISSVGEDGARAAWLLAQHADLDPKFQAQVLELMGRLLETREASPNLYAYLYDRTHDPQRFGTQGRCVAPGKWEPRALEDPANVDQRRAERQMFPPTLAEYAKLVGEQACK